MIIHMMIHMIILSTLMLFDHDMCLVVSMIQSHFHPFLSFFCQEPEQPEASKPPKLPKEGDGLKAWTILDRLDWGIIMRPIVGIQPGLTNRTYRWDGKRVFFMAPLKGTVYDWEVLKNWCLMQLSVMVIGLPL